MTPKQCKAYVRKVVKIKRWNGSYSPMIGHWVVGSQGDYAWVKDEVKFLRQAILETIMVDLVLDKEVQSK